ncbi:uncharacterized protein LOC119675104 [Teleopsis dalmanni]|uniref:uncharacterized protein LOC119675104 n=1 Tax=Teleopsis dalmanni TaxID=139649 RepID=UPI0018CD18A7|nr:uncharacterized protein LOC119675104 [Teleopsis dalmanni]
MSKYFVFAIVLALWLCLVNSAAVGGRSGRLLDANTIIQRIIAEYEKLPGPSVHHPHEVATLIDPENFHLNF